MVRLSEALCEPAEAALSLLYTSCEYPLQVVYGYTCEAYAYGVAVARRHAALQAGALVTHQPTAHSLTPSTYLTPSSFQFKIHVLVLFTDTFTSYRRCFQTLTSRTVHRCPVVPHGPRTMPA